MVDQDALDFGRLRRLDCVARNYSELGALRLVPVGLFALLMAVLVGGLVELSAYWTGVAGVWAVQATVASVWLVALWYRNNYGMTLEAWPGSRREARRWALVWAGAVALVAAAVGDGAVVGLLGHLAGAAAMAWMLLHRRRTGRMWPQGYALTALLATGCLMHVASSLPPLGQRFVTWELALLGATLVMIGVSEHRRLAREARPLEEDGDG